MDRNKVIAGSLAFALAAPYLVPSLTNPMVRYQRRQRR
jgi:hypothetical protein